MNTRGVAADPELQARLSAWAWEKLAEASDTGQITLQSGQVVDLLNSDKENQMMARTVLAHIKSLAFLTARRRHRVETRALLDDWLIPESR